MKLYLLELKFIPINHCFIEKNHKCNIYTTNKSEFMKLLDILRIYSRYISKK